MEIFLYMFLYFFIGFIICIICAVLDSFVFLSNKIQEEWNRPGFHEDWVVTPEIIIAWPVILIITPILGLIIAPRYIANFIITKIKQRKK